MNISLIYVFTTTSLKRIGRKHVHLTKLLSDLHETQFKKKN